MLKPASQTPLSALLLAELEEEAGLPPGWLNVVVGPASEIGDVLVEDERVRLITFTGSGDVGWGLRERAPRKKVSLELGNATPVIVEPRRRPRRRPRRSSPRTPSRSPGQSCISVQRIYVDARRLRRRSCERFVPKVEALMVGDPADEDTDVGPVIDADANATASSSGSRRRERGGEVLTGGELTRTG